MVSPHEETARMLVALDTSEEAGDFPISFRVTPYNTVMYRRRRELGLRQVDLVAQLRQIGVRASVGLIARVETLRSYPDSSLADALAVVLRVDRVALFPRWLAEFTRPRETATVHLTPSARVGKVLLQRIFEPALLPAATSDELTGVEERLDHQRLGLVLQRLLPLILKPREVKVLNLRFGFGGQEDRTFEQVGREFHVTRERIRQIELKALRELRSSRTVTKLLKAFLEGEPLDLLALVRERLELAEDGLRQDYISSYTTNWWRKELDRVGVLVEILPEAFSGQDGQQLLKRFEAARQKLG